MKTVIAILFLTICTPLYAEWYNNQYTQEFDYYTPGYHCRDTINVPDISTGTANATYIDWDLSNIVPSGAVSVVIAGVIKNASAGQNVSFRKNGLTGAYDISSIYTQVANVFSAGTVIVPIDSDGIIEYRLSSSNWDFTEFWIKGWFK